MYCANCNFIFHSRPYWNTSYRLLELKRYPAPNEFKSSLSETLAELLLTWLACKSLWSSCTSHEELGGQAAPKSHEGETRKFIRNCFSNPRLLLMWGMHASVDLKRWWTSFLGNVYSILTPSLIAPKHLKETSKSHHIGWEKKSFFFFFLLWTKSQDRGAVPFSPWEPGQHAKLQKWTIHVGPSGELVLMWNCNLDWRPISCMPY